jgi:hypothetical protein
VSEAAKQISCHAWTDQDDQLLAAALDALTIAGGAAADSPVHDALRTARTAITDHRAEADQKARQPSNADGRNKRTGRGATGRPSRPSNGPDWQSPRPRTGQPVGFGQKVGAFFGSDAGTRPLWSKATTGWREVATLSRAGAEHAVAAWGTAGERPHAAEPSGFGVVDIVGGLPDKPGRPPPTRSCPGPVRSPGP